MNTNNICILGAEIQEVMWKIGTNPWASNFIQPFIQGDQSTAILKVTLEDCSGFEGKTLEAFVQVPNDANDIVKIFALIDSNNQALFTLPKELLWWPGDYNVNFMFADGNKVNYSNVLNAAYTVNENPALAGQNPPTILPGNKAEYEDLISRLSAQTTKAEAQIPQLETQNTRAESNISTITGKNTEAEQKISDLTGKIAEGNAAQVKWQDTIDNGEAKIGDLDVKIQETNQKLIEADNKISDVEDKIVQAEDEIDKMEEAVAKGVKEIDDAVNALPDQIKKIEDKTTEGLTSLTDQEAVSVQNIKNQETTSTQNVNNQGLTSVQSIKDQEATSKQELTAEGANQRNLISTAGNTEVLKVTNEGHTQKNSIITEGDNQKGIVTAEGTKQTGLVKTQGDTSLAAVQKVQTDVEAIIQGDPAGGNAIALGGKTRAEFDGEIQENKEQLQNCVQAIDSSIVAYIGPQGISSNVVGDDPINTGGNVIEGTGVSFVKTENGFGIGEGYENLTNLRDNVSYKVEKTDEDNVFIVENLIDIPHEYTYLSCVDFSDLEVGADYTVSWEVLSGAENFYRIRFWSDGFAPVVASEELEDTLTSNCTTQTNTGLLLYFKQGVVAGNKLKIKIQVTKTSNKVPFVPYRFKGGELKFSEPWTSATHSFIGVGFLAKEAQLFFKLSTEEGNQSGTENFYGGECVAGEAYDCIISNSCKKYYDHNDASNNLVESFTGVSGGFVTLSRNHAFPGGALSFGGYIIIKGDVTEAKGLELIRILKSNNYQLPPQLQGTTFPISDMVRRADKYGIVEMSIEVTDNSRDLWYSADEGIYEVMDNNLDVTRIKSEDINSTSSPIMDVSGRGRLNAAITLPAYVRKVK